MITGQSEDQTSHATTSDQLMAIDPILGSLDLSGVLLGWEGRTLDVPANVTAISGESVCAKNCVENLGVEVGRDSVQLTLPATLQQLLLALQVSIYYTRRCV